MAKSKKTNKPITDESEATLEKVVGSSKDEIVTQGVGNARSTDQFDSSVKEAVTPKSVFNTKKAAELVGVGDTGYGNSVASLGATRSISFSGGAGNVKGDISATTRSDSPRKSGDRPGRTMDTALKHIDDVIAETYSVPLTTIPQLRDGNSNVGYNGNYFNAHAVSQKGSGGNPASSKFFRTLDLITYDNLYFTSGQNVYGETLSIHTYDTSTNDYAASPVEFSIGNYLTRGLSVTITSDGQVSNFEYSVEDLTTDKSAVSEDVYRLAGDALLRNHNTSELDRLSMVATAGDETKDNWSPLGETIRDATDANRMIKEIDAVAGDFAFLSISKLRNALAYQLNKSAKDGNRRIGPMFEMCLGNVEKINNNVRHRSSTEENDATLLFNDLNTYLNGSAALYTALKDTTTKYNTKGKLLSLPLSFKSALDTAKMNCGSLMMHDTFYTEYNRQEVFGKVDEDGSGMTPVFMSDGAGIILPINLNQTSVIVNGQVAPAFTLHYEDIRNKYNFGIYDFFTQGLYNWFVRHAGKMASLFKNTLHSSESSWTINIPITSTQSCISLWDLIVCDAMKDIALERQYSLNLVLKYERLNHAYPYSGLTKLDNVTIGGSTNVGFTDINTPLTTRNIPLSTAVRLLMPETFTPKSTENCDLSAAFGWNVEVCQTILPWYFNQAAFQPTSGEKGSYWTLKPGDGSHMTFFDVRGGVTFGNMDRIIAMDPEQLKFAMDRMVDIPGRHAVADVAGYTTKAYKYSLSDDGMVVVPYKSYYHDKDAAAEILSTRDILKAHRELGLSMIAPAGVITPAYDSTLSVSNYRDLDSSYLATSGPSFRLQYWHAADEVANTLFDDHVDMNAEFNFKAYYNVMEATAERGDTDIGIDISSHAEGGVLEAFVPFTVVTGDASYDYSTGKYNDGESPDTSDKAIELLSYVKYMYARIQLLPFIINPFDANSYIFTTDKMKYTNINVLDDFDFLHLYNVCGFRDGEYSGTEFDRNKARIEMGLSYVQDPYIERRL